MAYLESMKYIHREIRLPVMSWSTPNTVNRLSAEVDCFKSHGNARNDAAIVKL